MRLGAFPCELAGGSVVGRIYGQSEISERHRHRYEFNRAFEGALAGHGLVFSGHSPDRKFVEVVELPDHPWFIGCQFHPEFKSRPLEPHPLFASFIGAANERRGARKRAAREAVAG
jgi:CTP synthase